MLAALVSLSGGVRAEVGAVWLLDSRRWDKDSFVDGWTHPGGGDGGVLTRRYLKEPLEVFGVEGHVSARFERGFLVSASVVFLDAGSFIGYGGSNLPGLEPAEIVGLLDEEFGKRSRMVKSVLAKAAGVGGEGPEPVWIGKKAGLGFEALLYELPNVVARLVEFEGQLLAVDLFPTVERAMSLVSGDVEGLRRREVEAFFEEEVEATDDGGVWLSGVPLVVQGNRAYCAMSALAMAGHFMGIELGAEEFAAVAGYRYGDGGKARVREVFSEAGEVLGLRVSRGTRFDFSRAKRSIDAGFPVVVFRYWSKQRDYLHTVVAQRRARGDAAAVLPEARIEDRKQWPGKGSPLHASVVHGYHEERGEVIFSESWAAGAMGRRMRAEEMEGTSYYVVYFGN